MKETVCKNCIYHDSLEMCICQESELYGKCTDVSCKCDKFSDNWKFECSFCNHEKIRPDFLGQGIKTPADNAASLFASVLGTEKETTTGIRLFEYDEGSCLAFDNSAGEYAEGVIEIRYCPLCGRNLRVI